MGRVLPLEALAATCRDLREQGKRIVFTNGCFDILHVGHTRYLQKARETGDCLVVAVNSDASVRGLKGPTRPIVPQAERAEMLAALGCVDFVTIFDAPTPLETIKALKPHFLVKGGDWSIENIVGGPEVRSWGGDVKNITYIEGSSTSNIIEEILNRHRKE
ncbi:MAG: D-glycero-beta-D-manno-heptose 1-phosphate adenylyltransferase [Nitrospirota bacterium]|nr:D-glycero-beta-D-manno-heptose 1-phosphate adenylyltransferase [Nitrospirota bacterium]